MLLTVSSAAWGAVWNYFFPFILVTSTITEQLDQ